MKTLLAALLVTLLSSTNAQQPPPGPPSETEQFSFWAGEWQATGKLLVDAREDKWVDNKATDSVKRILEGRVFHQTFSDGVLSGQSWSVYVPHKKKWQQTWVDNQGSYLLLEGEFKDGQMVLYSVPDPAGPKMRHRMVFSDIKADSFSWRYEYSLDEGKSWKPQWRLSYKRKG